MTSINSRTTIREQLTFEQYQELKRKRNKEYNLLVLSIFNKIGNFIWLVFKLFFILFVSVLAGHSTEPLIYKLNTPLGIGYAHFASYVETALIMLILYLYIIQPYEKRK